MIEYIMESISTWCGFNIIVTNMFNISSTSLMFNAIGPFWNVSLNWQTLYFPPKSFQSNLYHSYFKSILKFEEAWITHHLHENTFTVAISSKTWLCKQILLFKNNWDTTNDFIVKIPIMLSVKSCIMLSNYHMNVCYISLL